MTKAKFNVLIEWERDDRAWVAYVPALNWLSTFGETREEVLERVHEAIIGYMEAAEKEGIEIPKRESKAELTAVEVKVP
ncbi:MAG: type II toxin-antitoxin system HicB family antitoxin [SAR202 cluster bacterium]|nr:type II toxin-antitoxin system HicB family antitoxin [SAR202 cluster bacterium]